MTINVRRSGSWVRATRGQVRRRANNQWQDMNVFARRNNQWVNINQQTFTMAWDATWSQTYRETNALRTDSNGRADWRAYQGQFGGGGTPWGIQRALIGFPNLQSQLAGATITRVRIRLHAEHWWFVAGGTVFIGRHNHVNRPNTFSHQQQNIASERYTARNQTRWVDLPISFGNQLRDGQSRGISFFRNDRNLNHYGYFTGSNGAAARRPRLEITFIR